RIKTFVVGFQISGSAALNCDAVHGKSARRDVPGCDTLTPTTCDDNGAPTCYYDATDPTALQSAFDDVVQQVSSCRFTLTGTPPDRFGIFVYLEANGNPDDRQPIFDGVGFHYDASTNQMEFFGSACDQVKSGARIPIVIYGCAQQGG